MRNRHKVPGVSGAASHLRSLFFRIVLATNLNTIIVADSIRWLSGTGVSSHGKMPVKWG
jgi:hypothetical protein